MKRQIIKTRPVRPYRIARTIIAIVIAAILIGILYFAVRVHAQHAGQAWSGVVVWQDSLPISANPRTPIMPSRGAV